GLLLAREEPRALEDDVDAELAPRQLRRIALGADADAVAVDDERIAVHADLVRERAVRRVETGQVRVGLRVAEIVDRDDRNVLAPLALVESAQNVAADPAIAIDGDLDGHTCLLVVLEIKRDSAKRNLQRLCPGLKARPVPR